MQGINPDEAVACGAVVMAAKLRGETTKMLKELVLLDFTPLSLGVEVRGEIMSVVIPRDTPIPMMKTKTFRTYKDNQYSMKTIMYQGEQTRTKDNYLLGQFTISGIPPAPKGVSKVEDCFEIDANGILTVTSKVISTGKTESLTVINHRGRLSKLEIEKMVKDAEKLKIEDQQYKKKVNAYNALEDFLYVLKKKMKGYNTVKELTQEGLKRIQYAIDDTTKWLSNNKVEVIDEIEAKKEYLEHISKLAF